MRKVAVLLFALFLSGAASAQKIAFTRGKFVVIKNVGGRTTLKQELRMKLMMSDFIYIVTLKNDSTLEANSEIFKEADTGDSFIYFRNKKNEVRKIYPQDTKFISHKSPFDSSEIVVGEPIGNAWVFLLNRGKISTFADFYKDKSIKAMQVEDRLTKEFSVEQLKSILKEDKRALTLLAKGRYYDAIEVYNKNHEEEKKE